MGLLLHRLFSPLCCRPKSRLHCKISHRNNLDFIRVHVQADVCYTQYVLRSKDKLAHGIQTYACAHLLRILNFRPRAFRLVYSCMLQCSVNGI